MIKVYRDTISDQDHLMIKTRASLCGVCDTLMQGWLEIEHRTFGTAGSLTTSTYVGIDPTYSQDYVPALTEGAT